MPLPRLPKVTWGTSFANTLNLVIDNAHAYPCPRAGSVFATAPSGEADAILAGINQMLAFTARWIPTATVAAPPFALTGWDGATGWDGFLQWMWQMNTARWYPDATSGTYWTVTLVAPLTEDELKSMPLENNGDRNLAVVLRSTADTAFTGY